MAKTVGYMVTWTTYGTWLQGDKRRYVKDGRELQPDSKLYAANLRNLQKEPVRLTAKHKEIIRRAILDKATQLEQKILAIAVCQNHVHLVIAYNGTPIESSIKRYKNAALVALREGGLSGRLWSTGFYKQFCFDDKALRNQISYVNSHNRRI